MILALALSLSLVSLPDGGAPAGAGSPAGLQEPKGAPQAGADASDDLDLLAKEKPPDAAALERQQRVETQLGRRRKMLQLHQLGGFLTLGALTATVVLGQLNYADKYGGGGYTERFQGVHKLAAFTSTALFAATGALAIFAPSPLEKHGGVDTATLHKVCVGVAAAGMLAEVALGLYTGSRSGHLDQRDFALAHQIVGYTTLAATAAGLTVFAF